jgi:hypothetical protein
VVPSLRCIAAVESSTGIGLPPPASSHVSLLSLRPSAAAPAAGCRGPMVSVGTRSPTARPISSAFDRPSSDVPAWFTSVIVPSGVVTSRPSCMLLRMRSTASREIMVRRRLALIASSARASSPISSERWIATRASSSPRPIRAVKAESAWIGRLRPRDIRMADAPAATSTEPAIASSQTRRVRLAASLSRVSSDVRWTVSRSIRSVVNLIVTTPSSWSPRRTGALTSSRPGCLRRSRPSSLTSGACACSAMCGRTEGSGPPKSASPALSITVIETTSGSALAASIASRAPSTFRSASGLTSASAVTRANPRARFSNWSASARAKVRELVSLASSMDRSYCRISAADTAAIAAVTSIMIAAK